MNSEELKQYFTGTANMLNPLADKVEAIRIALDTSVPGFREAYRDANRGLEHRSAVSSLDKHSPSLEQALQVADLIVRLSSEK